MLRPYFQESELEGMDETFMAERIEVLLNPSEAVTPELPPALPPDVIEELHALNCLNGNVLWAVARSHMITSKQRRWRRLIEKNQRGLLTEPERKELSDLTAESDRLTLCKAQAYLLLKQRGYRIPELDEPRW